MGGNKEMKSKAGPHSGKPPLYKQSQKAQRGPDAAGESCLPPLNESGKSDPRAVQQQLHACVPREGAWREPRLASAAEVFEAFQAELRNEDQERERSRADDPDSRASSLDFDVTLLPEVTLPRLEKPHRAGEAEEETPLLLNRREGELPRSLDMQLSCSSHPLQYIPYSRTSRTYSHYIRTDRQ